MDDFYAEDLPSGDDLTDELYRHLAPYAIVLLHRECAGRTESLWLSAYAAIRLVVETYPPVRIHPDGKPVGLVREIHTGPDAELRTFNDRLALHLRSGWTVKPITVYSGDPWDATASFDKPAEF